MAEDDYDYAAYTKKYGKPDQSKGQHLTDEFKRPNHITFSDESVYHSDKTPGGKWSEDKDKKWHYTPSDFVLKQHGADKLQKYFKEKEPDATLHLPSTENDSTKDYKVTDKITAGLKGLYKSLGSGSGEGKSSNGLLQIKNKLRF